MRFAFLATLGLLLLPAAHGADIRWTVRFTETFAEGILLQRASFTDGEKTFGISMDDETTAVASGTGTDFTFKGVPSAVFRIGPSPLAPAQPFTAEHLERYRTAAKMRVPPGIDTIADFAETADPLALNRWKSFRVAYTFSHHGKKIRKCVTFLTLKSGQQAMLETSAYVGEFAAAMERAEYLIRSWHELEPQAAAPAS